MTSEDDFRRLLPPPRRRPNALEVLLRWRFEIVALVGVGAAWYEFGGQVVAVAGLILLALVAVIPPARRLARALLQVLVVPHRVRAGLVQAGVADRGGRLPWLVAARSHGESVRVTVWLRAGTTIRDLVQAAPVIGAACGALSVDVERHSVRQDRVQLVVVRPRWGWWTR